MVTSGGGCSTAIAVSWPARIKDKGAMRRQFTHALTTIPTILEAAGVPAPKVVNGAVQKPMEGLCMSLHVRRCTGNGPAHDSTLLSLPARVPSTATLVGWHTPWPWTAQP